MPKARGQGDDEDLVRLYLNDISRYPLLTRADEVRLAEQIEEGNQAQHSLDRAETQSPAEVSELRRIERDGQDARQTLVQSNLRLVVSIAKKYQQSGLPLLDLIQEGNFGLMHAVGKFDGRRGFKFSTYATWWIRQAVARGIANTGHTIRIPIHVHDRLANVRATRSRLEVKLGRRPSLRELAAELEMSEDRVAEVLAFPVEPVSLSDPLGDAGGAERGDLVVDHRAESPFEEAATALMPAAVEKLFAPLDDRERRILSLRFGLDHGEPHTLSQVGESLNLTRERIRQIEARALTKLRDHVDDTARDLLLV